MVDEGSLRERKKEKTREALQAAATRLFHEKGYAETSVDDIAAAADVSRRTFFRYFGSKEGVVFGDADESGEQIRAALLAEPPEKPGLKAFRDVIIKLTEVSEMEESEVLARQSVVMQTLELRSRAAELSRVWRFHLGQALAEREGRSEPSERDLLAAGVGIAVIQSAMEAWVASGGRGDLKDRLEESFDYVLNQNAG